MMFKILIFWILALFHLTVAVDYGEISEMSCSLDLEEAPLERQKPLPKEIVHVFLNDLATEKNLHYFYDELTHMASVEEFAQICQDFEGSKIGDLCAGGHFDEVAHAFLQVNTLPERLCGKKYHGYRFFHGEFVHLKTGEQVGFMDGFRCRAKIWANMQATLQGKENELLNRTGILWQSPWKKFKSFYKSFGSKKESEAVVEEFDIQVQEEGQASTSDPAQAISKLLLKHGGECQTIRKAQPFFKRLRSALRAIGEFVLDHRWEFVFLLLSLSVIVVAGIASAGITPSVLIILALINCSLSAGYSVSFFSYQMYQRRKRSAVMDAFLDQVKPTIEDLRKVTTNDIPDDSPEIMSNQVCSIELASQNEMEDDIFDDFLDRLQHVTSVSDLEYVCNVSENAKIQDICQNQRGTLIKIIELVAKWNRLPGKLCGVEFQFAVLAPDGRFFRNGHLINVSRRKRIECARKLIRGAVHLREMQLHRAQQVVINIQQPGPHRNMEDRMNLSEDDLIKKLMSRIRTEQSDYMKSCTMTAFSQMISDLKRNARLSFHNFPFMFRLPLVIFSIALGITALSFVTTWSATAVMLLFRFTMQMIANGFFLHTSIGTFNRIADQYQRELKMRTDFLAAHLVDAARSQENNSR